VSAESIERRREGILRRLAEGPVVREVLRESFPNAIQLQPDESGKHLWAVFVYEEGATRINLLYGSEEERINAETRPHSPRLLGNLCAGSHAQAG